MFFIYSAANGSPALVPLNSPCPKAKVCTKPKIQDESQTSQRVDTIHHVDATGADLWRRSNARTS